MSVKFEELRVLQSAELIADGLWKIIVSWERFAITQLPNYISYYYGKEHLGSAIRY